MKQFNEVLFGPVTLVEKSDSGKGDILGTVECPFIICDIKNMNGRSYPASIIQNEIARVQKRLKEGHYPFGSGDHPDGAEVKIGEISHRIAGVYFDEKTKRAMAKLEILNTSKGRDLAVVLRKGKIGVSARGTGNTRPGTISDQEVCSDYQLRGIDFTLSPSFEECMAGGLVFESAQFVEASEAPKPSCGELTDEECRIAGVPFALWPKRDYRESTPKKVLRESVENENGKDEDLTDAEVEEVLNGMSEEEREALENMSEEELDKLASMSDDELDAYLAAMEDVKEKKIINSPSLTESFLSLDTLIRAAVENTFGKESWIKDFSPDEIVFTIQNPGSPDVLMKIGYKLTDKGIEFTSDPVVVSKVEDYEEVTEQSLKKVVQKEQKRIENNPDLRFGELSEKERTLSGYTKRFATPDLKLSENENVNALSQKERELLRKQEK